MLTGLVGSVMNWVRLPGCESGRFPPLRSQPGGSVGFHHEPENSRE